MSNGGKIRMAFNHAYVSELVDALLAGSSQRKKPVLRVEVAFTAFKSKFQLFYFETIWNLFY